MQATLMMAAFPCASFAMLAWRSRRNLGRREGLQVVPATPTPTLAQSPLSSGSVLVQSAIEAAARSLEGMAKQHMARISIAVTKGLAVRADPATLQQILVDLIGGALSRSAGGRILVCAGHRGGRIQISVTDDGTDAEQDRLGGLSATRESLALQGATIETRRWTSTSVAVIVRLLAPPDREAVQTTNFVLAPEMLREQTVEHVV